jgi:hypothetical protein
MSNSSEQECSSVHEIVASEARLSKSQIFSFQRLLKTADTMTDSCFRLKSINKKRRLECKFGPATKKRVVDGVKLGFGDSSDDDEEDAEAETAEPVDTQVCRALVKTLCALTSAEEPGRLETPQQAMRWASNTLLEYKKATVDKTRRESQLYVFNTDQTMAAFKLMTELNSLLSQTRTKAQ